MLISVSSITSNLPPIVPGVGGIVLTGMQSFLTASSFSLESNPLTRAKYSKFVDKKDNSKLKMIDSRDGMTLIYLPAFAASTIITILSHITEFSFLPQSTLAGQFVIIHFLKRLLEVFFLHKYSGKVSQSLSTQIGIYYAIVSVLILSVADPSSSINAVNTKIASGKIYLFINDYCMKTYTFSLTLIFLILQRFLELELLVISTIIIFLRVLDQMRLKETRRNMLPL